MPEIRNLPPLQLLCDIQSLKLLRTELDSAVVYVEKEASHIAEYLTEINSLLAERGYYHDRISVIDKDLSSLYDTLSAAQLQYDSSLALVVSLNIQYKMLLDKINKCHKDLDLKSEVIEKDFEAISIAASDPYYAKRKCEIMADKCLLVGRFEGDRNSPVLGNLPKTNSRNGAALSSVALSLELPFFSLPVDQITTSQQSSSLVIEKSQSHQGNLLVLDVRFV
ncbi:unnamed protein product [Protopolystoma xenopodis]|uniref:Uncharacterized protein n=1 Tax=Protopolystoma xenopodis TaxID=117903 RepID=A0A448X494_9PLAT|nr:unnamed protein product [Protopolystoma xenopodis]